MFWDFISLRPETTHQVSFLFSDRGTPDGFRHMNGYGSHTFRFVNKEGESVYVKFHFKTDQKIKNLSDEKAAELSGSDPDYSTRDLFNAIAKGDYPSWTLYIQIMTVSQADLFTEFNPFDLTKIWPQKDFPLIQVGKLVLDTNPKNYFAEVEQLAFAPSHLVPGVEPSPDKMLQARLYSYADTHRHRLGVNYQQIPVNCPYNTHVQNYQRDGPARVDGNQTGAPNYFPNSFGGPQPDPSVAWHKLPVSGNVDRFLTDNDDNFTQAGIFYNKVLDTAAKDRLTTNIANHLSKAAPFIQQRAIANFAKADSHYGKSIEEKIAKINLARSNL